MAPLTLCALVWAVPGREDLLTAYEDEVLALLSGHGARVLSRARSQGDGPHEVQLLEFPSERDLSAFMEDPARTALAAERTRVVARTELIPVDLITG